MLVRKAEYGMVGMHPQANMRKYGEKKLMTNSYPARGANAKVSNDI
jgi:hypothetical protein